MPLHVLEGSHVDSEQLGWLAAGKTRVKELKLLQLTIRQASPLTKAGLLCFLYSCCAIRIHQWPLIKKQFSAQLHSASLTFPFSNYLSP